MEDSVADMVRQWADVLPGLEPAGMAISKRVVRLGQELGIIGGDALAEFDLDPGEFDVLATLLRVGPPHCLSPTALFQALLVSSSGMTKRIDRLEARGLVTRMSDPADRRSRLVALTPDGVRLTTAAVTAHAAAMAVAVEHLDPRARQSLDHGLAALLAALERARQG